MTMQLRDESALLMLVHDALRRDTVRLRTATTRGDVTSPRHSEALRRGWQLMHQQLLRHNREQDIVLLPTARIYLPARHEEIAVLDLMERGHRRVEMLATAVDTALLSADVVWFAEAVGRFDVGLIDHLAYVESAAVPLLETTLGERDWREYGRAQRRALATRGSAVFWPWVLDGADPDRAAQVTSRLPSPVRTLITRVWQPRYAETPRWS